MPTYTERRHEVLRDLRSLTAAQPDVMNGFSSMHEAAIADAALSPAVKELIALALAVHARCDGCISIHVAAAVDAGATREQIADALGVAVLMGGGPAPVYAGEAMTALGELLPETSAT
ncbi:MAG: carboxymuconolactone decarboxylase family protein [Miltoncostaeaceae bacterium]